MSNASTTTYLGQASGPTPEMLAVALYASLGFWILLTEFALFLVCALALAIKGRARGSGLTLSGLFVVLLYFVFQNTLAQDAELRYGRWADAVSLIAYGSGALLVSLGYARLALSTLRRGHGLQAEHRAAERVAASPPARLWLAPGRWREDGSRGQALLRPRAGRSARAGCGTAFAPDPGEHGGRSSGWPASWRVRR